jgi:hypothetical protein
MEEPIDPTTIPHEAIDAVIRWLGVNYETEITRKSDGAKMVLRILTKEKHEEKQAELERLRNQT